MRNTLLLALLLGPLVSCQTKKADADFVKVNQEIRDRKIRRLTEAQIEEAAYAQAGRLATLYQQSLKGTPSPCGHALPSLPDSLQPLLRSAQLVCQAPADSSSLQGQLWQAYNYQLQQGQPLRESLQPDPADASVYIYAAPLGKGSPLTLLYLQLNKKEVIRASYQQQAKKK